MPSFEMSVGKAGFLRNSGRSSRSGQESSRARRQTRSIILCHLKIRSRPRATRDIFLAPALRHVVQKPVGLQRHERRHPDAAAGLPEKLHERAVILRERRRCDSGKVRLFGMVGYGLPVKIAVRCRLKEQNNLRALARIQPALSPANRAARQSSAPSARPSAKLETTIPLLRKRARNRVRCNNGNCPS